MEQLLDVRRPSKRRGRELEMLVRCNVEAHRTLLGEGTGDWERLPRWDDSCQPIGDLVGKLKAEARRMERERYAGGRARRGGRAGKGGDSPHPARGGPGSARSGALPDKRRLRGYERWPSGSS